MCANQGPPQISICGECEGNSALYGAKRHLIALFAARIRGLRQNLQSNVLVGRIGGTRRLNERGAVSPCDRVADDSVPFHRGFIVLLSYFYRGLDETQLLVIVDNC